MRILHVANENLRTELLCLLKKYAFENKEVTLASGQKSHFYIDCKRVSFRADGAHALGFLFFDILTQLQQRSDIQFEGCGGMALGAVPLATALSLQAFLKGINLHAVCVRSSVKDHGSRSLTEGATSLRSGARLVLVEDVVTTGGSTIKAAAALRDAGFIVDQAIAIVDREAGGEENLAKQGLALYTLYNLSDFRN